MRLSNLVLQVIQVLKFPNPTTEGDQSENEDQEEPGETDSYGGTAEAEDDFGGETVGNDEPEAKTADTLDQALKDLAKL